MDTIWYRNPSKSEVIGRCGGDKKKRMTTQNRQKPNDIKKKRKKVQIRFLKNNTFKTRSTNNLNYKQKIKTCHNEIRC